MQKVPIAGIRQVLHLSQIEVLSLPPRWAHAARILTPLAGNNINLEFVFLHGGVGETLDLVLGVKRDHLAAALGLLQATKENSRIGEIRSRDGVALISLFPHRNQA